MIKNRIIVNFIPLLIILVNGCSSNPISQASVVGKPTLAPPANVAQSELEEFRQHNGSSAGKMLMAEDSLQKRYISYLIEEGYKPTMDEYGDVEFKYEGEQYIILVSENDPEFFRIVLPNIWFIESKKERQKALVAADYATAEIKVAKVLVVGDQVWVSLELFISKPEQFKGIFKRSMSALQAATKAFVEKMRQSLSGGILMVF
ncbi:MAG: hypothetical protein ABFS56_28825 [Pseudomonadota bacterium]